MDLAEVLSRHGPAHPQGCGGGATTGLNFANRVAARHPFLQILLYRGKKAPHGAVLVKLQPYGQPEEETPAQDEQAQAPQALEVAPPPEAHVAEMSALQRVVLQEQRCPPPVRGGFSFVRRRGALLPVTCEN